MNGREWTMLFNQSKVGLDLKSVMNWSLNYDVKHVDNRILGYYTTIYRIDSNHFNQDARASLDYMI